MTHKVKITDNLYIGGNAPVAIQSMTNTDTANFDATTKQIMELADAGSELVRITVNNEDAAAKIADIRAFLNASGYNNTPLVGDFHYNGHTLLEQYPDCASALAKYRINPGNVGFGKKKDAQFAQIINIAKSNNKPVRIGVNWGSLDAALSQKLMDKYAGKLSAEEIEQEAILQSALLSAQEAIKLGLDEDKIIISCKVSKVSSLIKIYEELDKRCDFPLHLGLTEAGMGIKGITSSAAALAILLNKNIGNTIRVSLTPKPNEPRTNEVLVAKELLQSLGLRSFTPEVTACPGCGRTTSDYFQHLALDIQSYIEEQMPIWKAKYNGVEELKLAVMGCIVNGPGESRHANIGISLPGTGEEPVAPVFIDGKKAHTLRGKNISNDFKEILLDYVKNNYK